MKYLILESGEYSDYSVIILELPDPCSLSYKEIEFLLNLDRWDGQRISGEIIGEVKGWTPQLLKPYVEDNINKLFCCYDTHPVKTVLDRKRNKEELLAIAMQNDSSGENYWKREIQDRYEKYIKAFGLYQKLMG